MNFLGSNIDDFLDFSPEESQVERTPEDEGNPAYENVTADGNPIPGSAIIPCRGDYVNTRPYRRYWYDRIQYFNHVRLTGSEMRGEMLINLAAMFMMSRNVMLCRFLFHTTN